MPVPLEDPTAGKLRQAPEPFCLQAVELPVQPEEALLQPGIGRLGQNLGPQLVHHRAELAHSHTSNIGSNLPNGLRPVSERGHRCGGYGRVISAIDPIA